MSRPYECIIYRSLQYPLLAQTQLTSPMPERDSGLTFTMEQSAIIQGMQVTEFYWRTVGVNDTSHRLPARLYFYR